VRNQLSGSRTCRAQTGFSNSFQRHRGVEQTIDDVCETCIRWGPVCSSLRGCSGDVCVSQRFFRWSCIIADTTFEANFHVTGSPTMIIIPGERPFVWNAHCLKDWTGISNAILAHHQGASMYRCWYTTSVTTVVTNGPCFDSMAAV
jgi:hypothetical protein